MNWAQAELHDLELGDARRIQRLRDLVDVRQNVHPENKIFLSIIISYKKIKKSLSKKMSSMASRCPDPVAEPCRDWTFICQTA